MEGIIPILAFLAVGVVVIIAAIAAHRKEQQRREKMAALAAELGFRFDPGKNTYHDDEYAHFEIFRRGHSRVAHNTLTGMIDPVGHDGSEGLHPLPVKMGDFTYKVTRSNGKTTTTHTYRFSYVILHLPYSRVPDLLIRPEGFFDRIAGVFGYADINFESAEFSRRFHVRSPDKKFAYDVCHPRMMEFLMQSGTPAIDIEHGRCCLSDGRTRWEPAEFRQILVWAKAFFEQWPEHLVRELR